MSPTETSVSGPGPAMDPPISAACRTPMSSTSRKIKSDHGSLNLTEWCEKRPQFKALIERFWAAQHRRFFSTTGKNKSLRSGFRRSDKLASLELQLEFWEKRVTSAESQIEFKETDILKKYNKAYVDHAICVLKRGIDSGEYKSVDLKNPTRAWGIQLGKFFAESFASAYPDLKAWHAASRFAASRKNTQLRTCEIIKKYLDQEQDGGQQLLNPTLNAHVPNLRLLAQAAAAQSSRNSSDSISAVLGPSARCILQFLLLPSPGIVLNLP